MAKLFDQIRANAPKKNKFDLSHERKFSFQQGELIPILAQEVVPGDSFRVNSEIMLRLAPMLAPIMHRVNVRTEYFFVPNRIVWDEWEDFITGGRLGTSNPIAPYSTTAHLATNDMAQQGTLADYMGVPLVPTAPTVPQNISLLPFRAYQLIWDEYYRDQNLTASLDISKASGEQTGAELIKTFTKRSRAWEKDYFTSALPFAQRGPEVLMPIGGAVDVTYAKTGGGLFNQDDTPVAVGGVLSNIPTVGDGSFFQSAGESKPMYIKDIIEDISFTGSEVTINELRRSIRLQEWLEKNARGGGRYVEQILSHFGVKSSDARLQRPEYLGGGKAPVVVSEVLSTFQETDGEIPQGNMAGHGASYGTANGFKRTFEEHGFIIGLISVLPRTAYQQGIDKKFQRFDRFDYFWPEFANIGEQEVKNREIFYDQAALLPETVFGYQSRYAEYKYGCSSVHGAFRTQFSFWHMGRIFTSQPVLNEAFITADPTDRIYTVIDSDEHLYCHLFNKIDALRPMPYFGTPTL